MDNFEIRLILSRRQIRGAVVLGALFGLTYALHSATVKFSTTYPSPSGVYRKLIVTSSALLAREDGNVGVGTSSPQDKLDVNGGMNVRGTIIMGVMASDPAGSPGAVYYNSSSNEFRGYTNAGWRSLGGSSVPPGTVSLFNLGQCPLGWSELPAAQGRYLVGRPQQGSVGAIVGTPLTDREDRQIISHRHKMTRSGEDVLLTSPPVLPRRVVGSSALGYILSFMNRDGGAPPEGMLQETGLLSISEMIVSRDGSGSGSGGSQGLTNAPYIQFLACVKN